MGRQGQKNGLGLQAEKGIAQGGRDPVFGMAVEMDFRHSRLQARFQPVRQPPQAHLVGLEMKRQDPRGLPETDDPDRVFRPGPQTRSWWPPWMNGRSGVPLRT